MILFENLTDRNKCICLALKKGYSFKEGKIFAPSGRLKKLSVNNSGYLVFCFRPSIELLGRRYSCQLPVHRFVAYVKFGMSIFDSGIVVRHLDGNPLNNNESNIEIGSQRDNILDQSLEMRSKKTLIAAVKNRKFTDSQVEEIRKDSKINKMTYPQIMKKWGISSKGTLSYIINNEYKAKNIS